MKPALAEGEVAAILGGTSLFAGLDDEALRRLATACSQRTYQRGQYLWYQGDPGERLYLVVDGLVKVVLASDEGEEMVLTTVGPRQSIGELALIDGAPRSASVVAVEDTTVLMLARSRLLELLVGERAVLDAMLRSLGGLVRRLTEQTGDLVFLDLGARLAKLLLRLAESRATPSHATGSPAGTGHPVVLDLNLSQSDLAAMVGATRPAVNRALQVFATRGLIAVNGHVIELRDVPGLRRRAGL